MQEMAMTIVYDILIYNQMEEEVDIKNIVSSLCEEEYENCDIYLKEVAIDSVKYYQQAVEHLSSFMIKWKFSRLNTLAQAILILSYVHFYYIKDNDAQAEKGVVIDVAIRLAKKYLDDKDYRYINAILDKALCKI